VINNQRTVSKNIKFKGIGLHSGEPVEIKLIPEKNR
jgi:UDP-3-O-acyl-N-acetylglucosamine deacetylase